MKGHDHISPLVGYHEAMRQFLMDGPPAGANAKVVAAVCGHNTTYAYRYADADEPRHFPLEKLVPVILATRDFRLLDWMEAQVGRVAYKVPEHGSSLVPEVAKVLRETAAAVEATLAAVEDGRVSSGEAALCCEEIDEAMSALAGLRAYVVRESGRKS